MVSFSTALLAGGQSSRMGRDKALLKLPGSDLLLWQKQAQTLQELGPEEMLWSGPARPNLPTNMRLVPDTVMAAGPLAGVDACLRATRSDLLLVLAIDLPQMTSTFLRDLLGKCSPGCGMVARSGDFFEPLAAVYPRQLGTLSSAHLAQGRYAMQDFVHTAIEQGLLRDCALSPENLPLFRNLNHPSDFAALSIQCSKD